MFCFPGGERGSVLMILLLFTVVLQILAAALLTAALTENRIAREQERGTGLGYIAEAGLEQALAVKIKDFGFTGDIAAACGEGRYRVAITPDPENPACRHRIGSTGELHNRSLTLGVIVERRELSGETVLVAEDLTIERTTINGAVHCNHRLSIRGPDNRLLPAGGLPGKLTYSCPHSRIGWNGGGIRIGEESFSREKPFPEDWRTDPVPRPQIDLDEIREKHLFVRKSGRKEWRTAPDYGKVLDPDGRERQYLHIEKGDLKICPGAGEQFYFEGIIVVDQDVEIGGRGTIDLCGAILSGGRLVVNSGVNAGPGSKPVVLAAEKDLQVFGSPNDSTENPFFGGDLLLYSSGGGVTIGHQMMKGEQFVMHGIIFAKKIAICNCNLTHLATGGSRSGYFPAYGLVVTEWFQ